MKPYYQDEAERDRSGRFKRGVPQPKSEAHRRAIGEAQKRAWSTKRKRVPVGSTRIDANGYLRIKETEPCTYWRGEHLIIAEQMLGRPLRPGEKVHHINVKPADNRPDNLHVFPNLRAHSLAHGSINSLIGTLLERGVIRFNPDAGVYEMAE